MFEIWCQNYEQELPTFGQQNSNISNKERIQNEYKLDRNDFNEHLESKYK